MPIINYRTREINCKIVYVGPSLGGKTTNIAAIHRMIPGNSRTELQSIDTEGDRTLFFDYFSMDLEEIAGFKTKFLIYGVPGQPYYRSTRKMVLNGVDGLVFVADSDKSRLQDNIESLADLKSMLTEYGYDYETIPLVFQYNKRDLFFITPVEEFEEVINDRGCRSFEAIAIQNRGVVETFRAVCRDVVLRLNETLTQQYGSFR
ncbi:gliding-motility protein MglA [Candidatus Poribacteria bacterium]|nr:gliding-motility protein MglA [Candidatus Poribacteria bacterium]